MAAPGDLYEADFTSGNIYRFDSSGTRTIVTSGLNWPEGLAFDSTGQLFASETGTGTIYRVSSTGTKSVFASGLNGPASLVFGGAGRLYDADFFGAGWLHHKILRRIAQVHRAARQGNFLGMLREIFSVVRHQHALLPGLAHDAGPGI